MLFWRYEWGLYVRSLPDVLESNAMRPACCIGIPILVSLWCHWCSLDQRSPPSPGPSTLFHCVSLECDYHVLLFNVLPFLLSPSALLTCLLFLRENIHGVNSQGFWSSFSYWPSLRCADEITCHFWQLANVVIGFQKGKCVLLRSIVCFCLLRLVFYKTGGFSVSIFKGPLHRATRGEKRVMKMRALRHGRPCFFLQAFQKERVLRRSITSRTWQTTDWQLEEEDGGQQWELEVSILAVFFGNCKTKLMQKLRWGEGNEGSGRVGRQSYTMMTKWWKNMEQK